MRTCLECGTSITGRCDKKFCGMACRNAHNNSLHATRNNQIKYITMVLLRNRRLLEHFVQRPVIEIEELKSNGFNFEYFTHVKSEPTGDIRFCFDMAYWVDHTKQICLVKKCVQQR